MKDAFEEAVEEIDRVTCLEDQQKERIAQILRKHLALKPEWIDGAPKERGWCWIKYESCEANERHNVYYFDGTTIRGLHPILDTLIAHCPITLPGEK